MSVFRRVDQPQGVSPNWRLFAFISGSARCAIQTMNNLEALLLKAAVPATQPWISTMTKRWSWSLDKDGRQEPVLPNQSCGFRMVSMRRGSPVTPTSNSLATMRHISRASALVTIQIIVVMIVKIPQHMKSGALPQRISTLLMPN
jgi:hypothetical protein